MKSEMKSEEEVTFLQEVVGQGIDREELRDEIYVICKTYALRLMITHSFVLINKIL